MTDASQLSIWSVCLSFPDSSQTLVPLKHPLLCSDPNTVSPSFVLFLFFLPADDPNQQNTDRVRRRRLRQANASATGRYAHPRLHHTEDGRGGESRGKTQLKKKEIVETLQHSLLQKSLISWICSQKIDYFCFLDLMIFSFLSFPSDPAALQGYLRNANCPNCNTHTQWLPRVALGNENHFCKVIYAACVCRSPASQSVEQAVFGESLLNS